MRKGFKAAMLAGAMLAATCASGTVQAACRNLVPAINEAQDSLAKVARESELDDAKTQAWRASHDLDDASDAARDCRCVIADMEFDDARRSARDASDVEEVDDFVFYIRKAVRNFNNGVDAVRNCGLAQ